MKNNSSVWSPRSLAVKIIEKTLAGAKVQEAFDKHIEQADLKTLDRQLCSDLIYGYLRTKSKLDFIINQFLKKPEKLPAQMRLFLALGLYSLLFQNKIPPYAAVNETVNEIKKAFGPGLAKVANGVLRNIQKLEKKPHDIDWYIERSGDEIKAYSLFYSIPESVVRLWLNSYGKQDTLKLLARSASRPWQGIRVNPLHKNSAELNKQFENIQGQVKIGKFGYAFPPGQLPEKLMDKSTQDWIEEGALSLQSPGSMLIMEELGLSELKGPVWDCCAGSGIKSAALIERGVDLSLASDISRHRLKNIKPFCKRLNLENPEVIQASAARPPLKNWPGHIIADVPCTGLGVLARRPDIRSNVTKSDFWQEQSGLQKEIMKSLTGFLEADNKLVYITCTLNPYENEMIIRDILDKNPDLVLEKEWQTPHDHPWLEGMYGAVLGKKSSEKI